MSQFAHISSQTALSVRKLRLSANWRVSADIDHIAFDAIHLAALNLRQIGTPRSYLLNRQMGSSAGMAVHLPHVAKRILEKRW